MIKHLFFTTFAIATVSFAQTVQFTILTFNDVYEITPNREGIGGLAELATLLECEREMTSHHITTMNGDFLGPSLLSTFDHGDHNLDIFNLLGVDLLCMGNHEFDYGADVVRDKMKRTKKYGWLGANVLNADGSQFSIDPQTIIYDLEGVKIGFFGVVTPDTESLSMAGQDVMFAPVADTAWRCVQELKSKGADVIIALTHLSFQEDRQLSKDVPGIHVILGGHDHEPVSWYEGRTLIHKSGFNAWFLGRIDLTIEKSNGRTKVFPSWKVILNRYNPPSPEIAAIIARYKEMFEVIAVQPFAKVATPLDSRVEIIRSEESYFGNLVADALRLALNANAAIVCSGMIRGNRFYETGTPLSLKDLMEEMPFGNFNALVEISGADLLAALEHGVSQYDGKSGRYPLVSGLEFSFNPHLPVGSRVMSVYVEGEPLDIQRIYRVASIDYLLNGGDGYSIFQKKKDLINPDKKTKLIDVVLDYLKKLEVLEFPPLGRVHRQS